MTEIKLQSLRADVNPTVLPSTNCAVAGVDCEFLIRTKQGTSCANPNQALNIRGGGCDDRVESKENN